MQKTIFDLLKGNIKYNIWQYTRSNQNTIEGAINQAGKGGMVIIDVTKQEGATQEGMASIIERLKGKAKESFSYRIAGQGFELQGSVEKKKP